MARLLKALLIVTGVDMCNDLAPLMFGIALDPILRYLNQIPATICTKGYMDDTGTVGKGLAWISEVQHCWARFESTQLKVAMHNCIEWRPIATGSCTDIGSQEAGIRKYDVVAQHDQLVLQTLRIRMLPLQIRDQLIGGLSVVKRGLFCAGYPIG